MTKIYNLFFTVVVMCDYFEVKKFIFKIFKNKLSSKYVFHSLNHTKEVLHFAIKIANMEHIGFDDLVLLKTAALYHDTGFIFSKVYHEDFSAEFAKRTLQGFNYSQKKIDIIVELILCTKLDQEPKGILQQIICDADLMNFGNDTFFRKNRLIRNELKNHKIIFSDFDWAKTTKILLSNHIFFT